MAEVIELHGGEATDSRDAFLRLGRRDRNAIVEFLKTLQVLPEGETRLVIEE